MPIYAGQIVTAGQLTHLQPKKAGAVGSGTLTGPQTNADVVGATVTVTTETAGATYTVWCTWDSNMVAPSTGTFLGRLSLDGTPQTPIGAQADPDNGGRGTIPMNYTGILAASGSHTFKLVASPLTGQVVQGVGCSVIVEITEVV